MGAFFTNLQVHLPAGGGEEPVREALCVALAAEGFHPVADGDRSDRRLLVAAGGDWLSIYDELSESQDQVVLRALAAALSGALGRQVVTIQVHDSDVLEMALYRDGQLLDRFNSAPGLFADPFGASPGELSGKEERWRGVLSAGQTPRALRQAWSGRSGLAEDLAGAAADCLGVPRQRACMGFAYAQAGEAAFSLAELRFAADAGPAHDRERAKTPSLYPLVPPHAPLVGVGEAGRVQMIVQSVGEAGKGIVAVVGGPLVESGLIAPRAGRVWAPGAPAGQSSMWTTDVESVHTADGDFLVMRFDEAAIPEGVPFEADPSLPAAQRTLAHQRARDAQLHVSLEFEARTAGRAALLFAVGAREGEDPLGLEGEVEVSLGPPTDQERMDHMAREMARFADAPDDGEDEDEE